MKQYYPLLLLIALMLPTITPAQNQRERWLKVTGNVTAGEQFMNDTRYDLERPFAFNFSAGVNFNLFNRIDVPFQFVYSNQQVNINRPQLRFFGLSPSYKWVRLHGGYRTYNISPYLLNNRYVLGGGIDLTPGKFRLSFFYGDMVQDLNLLFHQTNVDVRESPMYRRQAMGGKIGFGSENNFFELSFLRVADDSLSGTRAVLDSLQLTPQSNFGLGINTGWRLASWLKFGGNGALSIVTLDQRAEIPDADSNTQRYLDLANSLLPVNLSTRFGLAYETFLETQIKTTNIRLRYEHIDPNYTSLGLHFIQADIDNYLIDLRTSLFKSRLSLFGSFGIQYSNSGNNFATKEQRLISNFSISAMPTTKLSLNLNYNNFNSTGNISVIEFVDSLKLTNTSESFSGTANYNFGKKGQGRHSISFNGSFNRFNLIQGEFLQSQNQSLTGSAGYNYRTAKSGWTFGGNLQYQTFTGMDQPDVTRYGVGLNVRKRLGKKFSFALMPSFNLNYTNNQSDGQVVNLRGNMSYNLFSNQALILSVAAVDRRSQQLNNFVQTRVAVQYNARF